MCNSPIPTPGPAPSSAPAASARALAAGAGARRATPLRPRRRRRRRTPSCCSACPTPRSPPRPPRSPPGPLVGHCSGRHGLDVARAARGVRPAPADDGHRAPAPTFAGAGCAVAGTTPRALAVARGLADGARDAPRRDRRRRPRRLPRRRVDRLELPRHARGRRRARSLATDRRRRASCSSRSCARRVENWAARGRRARAHRPDRPRRRGDRRAPARRRRRAHARSFAARLRRAGRHAHPRARREPRDEDAAHRRRAARRAAPARAATARTIGLVPTMGALHDGPPLADPPRARGVRRGRRLAVRQPRAVQRRAPTSTAYPRDEARDAALAADAGADLLFAPPLEEVYPPGFATQVAASAARSSRRWRAPHRGAGHFHGVTTVVTKLLNMVAPDVAYFGQKDAQQVARRSAAWSPTSTCRCAIEVVPTVREPDGLALSSRNAHLRGARPRARPGAAPRACEAAAARRTPPASATPAASAPPRRRP